MKTPREILLARHQAVIPKLDEIRRATVDDLAMRGPDRTESPVAFAVKLWRELILPQPQAWAGVAAIWVLIFALKLSTHDASRVLVGRNSSVAPAVIAEVRQQKLLFAELAGVPQLPDVKPSKPLPPRPRSARRYEIFAV